MSTNNEEIINTTEFLDIIKQILADSKTLIRQAKSNTDRDRDELVETARHAASLTATLEENVKNLKRIDSSNNTELASHVKVIVDSSQEVKDAMISLIKSTKTINKDATAVEEKITNIQNCCKQMSLGIKNMLSSVEHVSKLSKEARRVQPKVRERSKSKSLGHDDLTDSNNNVSAGVKRVRDIYEKALPILEQLVVSSKRIEKSDSIKEVFKLNITNIIVLWNRLYDIANDFDLLKEKSKLESICNHFINIVNATFDGKVSAMSLYTDPECIRIRIEDSLWWFENCVEYKEKLLSLDKSLGTSSKTSSNIDMTSTFMTSTYTPSTTASFIITTPSPTSADKKIANSAATGGSLNLNNTEDTSSSNSKYMIQIALPLNDVVKTVIVKDKQTVNEFLETVYEKYYAKKFPKRVAPDFCFKLPGSSIYIEGSEPFVQNKYVKDKLDQHKKISLVLVERVERFNMNYVPDSIIKGEEKAMVNSNEKEIFDYKGDLLQQLKEFEKNGKEVLATMIVHYNIKANSMKDLFTDDKYLAKLTAIKTRSDKELPDFKAVISYFEGVVDRCFDQYEGLRQISDFRSIAEHGDALIREGQSINSLFKKMLVSAQILILETMLDSHNCNVSYASKFEEAAKTLLRHFHSLKTGVLKQCHLVSSLREPPKAGGKGNLNCSYGRQFMKEILEATVNYIKESRKSFDDKCKELLKYPHDIQAKVYSKFHGNLRFDMETEKQLSQLLPYVLNWIEIQVVSILQREIFAKTRQELEVILEQTKSAGVNGFKELLSSKLIEATVSIDELYTQFVDEIELIGFAYGNKN